MDRQEIMERIANHFGIEANEDGEYDINDYNWQAGCSSGGMWLCLAEFVSCIEREFDFD